MASVKVMFIQQKHPRDYSFYNRANPYNAVGTYTYNVAYVKKTGNGVQIRVNAPGFVSINCTGFCLIYGREYKYYWIDSAETINKSRTDITGSPDGMLNLMMNYTNVKMSRFNATRLGRRDGVLYNHEGLSELPSFPKSRLDSTYVSAGYGSKIGQTVNGSSTGIFGTYYTSDNGMTSGNQIVKAPYPKDDFALGNTERSGKTVVGSIVPVTFQNRGTIYRHPLMFNSIIPNQYLMDSKYTKVSLSLGGQKIDLTSSLPSSNIDVCFPIKIKTTNDLYSDSYDSYSNVPAGNVYIYVTAGNYTIYNKVIKLPKSQQMYSKYHIWRINGYYKDQVSNSKSNVELLMKGIKGIVSIFKGSFDVGSLMGGLADSFFYWSERGAYAKDLARDFVTTVGGTSNGKEDTKTLVDEGITLELATYSTETMDYLKSIYMNNGLPAFNQGMYFDTVMRDYKFVQGDAIFHTTEMGIIEVIDAFKRGMKIY